MKRLLYIILILLFLVSAVVFFLGTTEKGLQCLFAGARAWVPGEFDVENVRGRLVGPIELEGLHYEKKGLVIGLDELMLDWKPMELFHRSAHIRELRASGLRIQTRPGEKAAPKAIKELPEITLPFSVKIENADVRDLVIISPEGGKPLVIDKIFIRADFNREILSVHELTVESPLFGTALKGSLKPKGDYPSAFQVEWNVRPKDFPLFRGSGEITGTLKTATVSHDLLEPARIELDATVREILTDAYWDAALHIKKAQLRKIQPQWPELEVTGKMKSKGGILDFHTRGSVQAAEAHTGNLFADFSIRRETGAWNIEKLLILRPESKSRLDVKGHVTPGQEQTLFDAEADWEALFWPVTGKERMIESPQGRVRIAGSLDDYTFQASASVAGNKFPKGDWNAEGTGNSQKLMVSSLGATLLDGTLNGKGSLHWKPELAWQLSLSGKNLNPGAHWSQWPGRLAMALSSSGKMIQGKPRASLDISELAGDLRGYPFRADSHLRLDGNRLRISAMEVTSGSAYLSVSGGIEERWSLMGKILIPDLAEVVPYGKGSITLDAKTAGPREKPQFDLRLQGKEIFIGSRGAEEILADLSLDLDDQEDSAIHLTATQVDLGFRTLENLTVKGRGRLPSHHIIMKVITEEDALDLVLDGAYQKETWQAMVSDAYLASIQLGVWSLEEPKTITVSKDRWEAENLCWLSNQSRVCLQGKGAKDGGLWVDLALSDVPLEVLQRRFPPSLEPRGVLQGSTRLSWSKEKNLTGKAQFSIDSGSISYIVGIEEPMEVNFVEASMDAELTRAGLDSTLNLSLEDGSELKGRIQVSPLTPFDTPAANRTIQGRVTGHIKDLGMAPAFFPELAHVEGSVKSEIDFAGTLDRPELSGHLTLNEGKADLPRLGIHLEEITLAASRGGKGKLEIQGKARSGAGQVKVKGDVLLHRDTGFPSRFNIQGSHFEIVNLPEAWAVVSPDLQFVIQKKRIDVAGQVTIPEAAIEPREITGTVPISKDVVIVDTSIIPEESETKRQIYSSVRITLGEKVKFDGFGLRGRIEGSLLAMDEPEKLTRGQGELKVLDGKYKAYGQKLEIERGRLLFSGGAIDDPGMDVKAFRRTGDVISGVYVRGTLKEPELELFSSSNLDQTDALSYLVLGRSSDQATSAEGEVLHNAAVSMGLSGGGFLAEKIGESLGVEEIEIEGGTTSDDATLFIGKYLSPRLYISYGIGLFEPVSIFRLRYQISSKWMMQTEYGIESGADLIYKIER